MSEYQYYEFVAVDRALIPKQIEAVRKFSTRAEISATRFVNEYHFGDFRGNPDVFLTRYFDLMVYFANWGTHRLMIGLAADAADLRAIRQYENEWALRIQKREKRILLDFRSEEESGDWEEDEAWMASLAPIRAEILAGDFRSLFLAWLGGAALDEDFDGDSPPIPAGLKCLTPAQKSLAEFLRVDEDFLGAAAENSAPLSAPSSSLKKWIAALPQIEKNRILLSIATGDDPQVSAKMLRQYQRQTSKPAAGVTVPFEKFRQTAEAIRAAR